MTVSSAKLKSPGLTISAAGLLALLAGGFSETTVNFVGDLYVNEIIALLVVAIVGVPTILRRTVHKRPIIVGLILIFLGLAISDILNATATNNLLRGWANPLFAIILTLFFVYLFGRNERAILFWLAGSSFARLFYVDEVQTSALLSGGNAFKAQIAPILIPVLLIVAFQITRLGKSTNIWLFSLSGCVFILLGARSQGIFFVVAATILAVMQLRGSWQRYLFAVTVLSISYILYMAYVGYVLEQGGISNSFNQLSRAKNPYNPIDLIVQGRSEFFVALAAIRDAPLFGQGSWAQDSSGNYSELLALIQDRKSVYYADWIVSHSVILTAWLWGGVTAFIGALIVYFSIARRAIALIPHLEQWRPILIYMLIEISWHFLFSPFGHIRISFPVFIGITVALSQRYLTSPKGIEWDKT